MRNALFIPILLLFISCSRQEIPTTDRPLTIIDLGGTPTNTSDVYIYAKIDGKELLIKEEILEFGEVVQLGYVNAQSYQNITGENLNILNYTPSLVHVGDDTKPSIGLRFIGFVSNPNESTILSNVFSVDSYNFAKDDNSFGCGLIYTPGGTDKKNYISYGEQSNASFSVTSITPSSECDINHTCVTLTGTFSCRLFNKTDATDFIDVSQGVFKIKVQSRGTKY